MGVYWAGVYLPLFFLGLALAFPFPLGCFGISAVGFTRRIAARISSSVGVRVLVPCFGMFYIQQSHVSSGTALRMRNILSEVRNVRPCSQATATIDLTGSFCTR